ncbi:type II toxin-antitoxin system HicB family antitoxin [Leptolyngbya sp. AN03gr2]|uniref:type II toxin-antitoxin system HicB family antitoxin n=1 Tax=unclassified Leptolyngbya TaxID=2650499 RepID=UPI003D31127E
MNFYTMVLKRSSEYWVALCLENGIVGQGETQNQAIDRLKEAIDSFQSVYETEPNIYLSPVPIQELHEFLAVETDEPTTESYELRAVYA